MSESSHHECAAHFERIERVRDFPIHGTTVSVREELYRCTECGEEEYSFEQAEAAERRAGESYREQNGFLQADEISGMRRRWGVTQAQLESALGVGRKTVARWEAGRVLQSRALDNLLRAVDRYPAVLGFLAERQGAELHPASSWFDGSPPSSAQGFSIPHSLRVRLEREAEEEGVTVDVYVATVLAQGLERRSVAREVERMSHKLDEAISSRSHWQPEALRIDDEPWLQDHKQLQRNSGDKGFAL